jgi:hypothetical protein
VRRDGYGRLWAAWFGLMQPVAYRLGPLRLPGTPLVFTDRMKDDVKVERQERQSRPPRPARLVSMPVATRPRLVEGASRPDRMARRGAAEP